MRQLCKGNVAVVKAAAALAGCRAYTDMASGIAEYSALLLREWAALFVGTKRGPGDQHGLWARAVGATTSTRPLQSEPYRSLTAIPPYCWADLGAGSEHF